MKTFSECERLANNILLINAKSPVQTILVTSSTRKEGATTVAANLAYKLAINSSARVLLIDGNLRNPSLHSIMKVQQNNGLSGLLNDSSILKDVLIKAEPANLSLIVSGKDAVNPAELFDSNKFGGIMEMLKKEFEYIVIDSPPVNTYTDVHVVASQVDGVVLVIHAGKTRREVVLRGKDHLEMAQANILGVVLNRKKHFIPKFLYNRL